MAMGFISYLFPFFFLETLSFSDNEGHFPTAFWFFPSLCEYPFLFYRDFLSLV